MSGDVRMAVIVDVAVLFVVIDSRFTGANVQGSATVRDKSVGGLMYIGFKAELVVVVVVLGEKVFSCFCRLRFRLNKLRKNLFTRDLKQQTVLDVVGAGAKPKPSNVVEMVSSLLSIISSTLS